MALKENGSDREGVTAPVNSREIGTSPASVQLSVIYVNWNSLDFLEKSIASVLHFTSSTAIEIIVVNNASTSEGSQAGLEAIAAVGPGIRIFFLSENVGFAGANNLGASHAHGETLLSPESRY